MSNGNKNNVCPFCGSTDLSANVWNLDSGEVDALECNSCFAGAPKSVWENSKKRTFSPPELVDIASRHNFISVTESPIPLMVDCFAFEFNDRDGIGEMAHVKEDGSGNCGLESYTHWYPTPAYTEYM